MPIQFSLERWESIRETYRRWWAGSLGRPVLNYTLTGCDPGRSEPDVPHYPNVYHYDLSLPAERVVDRWDYDLGRCAYVGDGFPHVWPSFVGGVQMMLGARLENAGDTTWILPDEEREIADLSLSYDPDNVWLRRMKDLYRAATDRWAGLVQVGSNGFGYTLDVLSSFRPGEGLLYDLYDHPDDVDRLTWQIHDLSWRLFCELDAQLRPANPGYTDWTAIFSEEPYSMLQCDFAAMIGPEMFDRFVKPELVAACRRIVNPFYHLDGPGQLMHLDSLLDIEELKGIQWVPGTGQPTVEHWFDIYRRVREAGKLIQLFDNQAEEPFAILDRLADALGSAEGIIVIGWAHRSREDEVMRLLERYGADPATPRGR